LNLGGSKARALLGGVVVIAILGAVASEVGAGPAGAARQQATTTEMARPHWVRPVAAIRSTILEVTPLSLAADLATEHSRATIEQRTAVARWVAGVAAAKAAKAEADAAAAAGAEAAVEVLGARVTRDAAPASDASEGVPTDGDNSGTLACIRAHESDSAGGYSAVNSSSGAGGAYQALPSTWDGYDGYARAEDAPAAVQDQWAREAISASGTRPWAGSGC
jgi:Transglycosylase-like domain